ncbi:hypothetical protein HDU97_001961 [Phlyctochytrium planicorne]|nr:hypothetical protein HDU97_001961 [Phlyctochytrium planicorne]
MTNGSDQNGSSSSAPSALELEKITHPIPHWSPSSTTSPEEDLAIMLSLQEYNERINASSSPVPPARQEVMEPGQDSPSEAPNTAPASPDVTIIIDTPAEESPQSGNNVRVTASAASRQPRRTVRLVSIPLRYDAAVKQGEYFSEIMPSELEGYISNVDYTMRMKSLNKELSTRFKTLRDFYPALRTILSLLAISSLIIVSLIRVLTAENDIVKPVWFAALCIPLIFAIAYFVTFFKSQSEFKPLTVVEARIKQWQEEDKQAGLKWYTKRDTPDIFDFNSSQDGGNARAGALRAMFGSTFQGREPAWEIQVSWQGAREEAEAIANNNQEAMPRALVLPVYSEDWDMKNVVLSVAEEEAHQQQMQQIHHHHHHHRSHSRRGSQSHSLSPFRLGHHHSHDHVHVHNEARASPPASPLPGAPLEVPRAASRFSRSGRSASRSSLSESAMSSPVASPAMLERSLSVPGSPVPANGVVAVAVTDSPSPAVAVSTSLPTSPVSPNACQPACCSCDHSHRRRRFFRNKKRREEDHIAEDGGPPPPSYEDCCGEHCVRLQDEVAEEEEEPVGSAASS